MLIEMRFTMCFLSCPCHLQQLLAGPGHISVYCFPTTFGFKKLSLNCCYKVIQVKLEALKRAGGLLFVS